MLGFLLITWPWHRTNIYGTLLTKLAELFCSFPKSVSPLIYCPLFHCPQSFNASRKRSRKTSCPFWAITYCILDKFQRCCIICIEAIHIMLHQIRCFTISMGGHSNGKVPKRLPCCRPTDHTTCLGIVEKWGPFLVAIEALINVLIAVPYLPAWCLKCSGWWCRLGPNHTLNPTIAAYTRGRKQTFSTQCNGSEAPTRNPTPVPQPVC